MDFITNNLEILVAIVSMIVAFVFMQVFNKKINQDLFKEALKKMVESILYAEEQTLTIPQLTSKEKMDVAINHVKPKLTKQETKLINKVFCSLTRFGQVAFDIVGKNLVERIVKKM